LGISAGKTVRVTWGDGDYNDYTAGEATRTHAYAGAGVWTVTFSLSADIYRLYLQDAKLSGIINASNPMPRNLTWLRLDNLSNLTVGAGEIGSLTNLTTLYLYSLSNLTVGAGEIGSLTKLTYLYLNNLPSLTTGAGEIGSLTKLTYLYLVNLSNLTVGSGEIGNLTNLIALYLYNLSNCAVQTVYPNTICTIQYESNLSQASVDAVLAGLWSNKANFTYATPSIDLLGYGNAAPSGIYQDPSPANPSTGKEYKYCLINDIPSAGPAWSVTTA